MADDTPRGDLGGAAVIRGPGRRWGIVHFGPADGVCSVDDIGCGYCIGVPCKSPRRPGEKETPDMSTDTNPAERIARYEARVLAAVDALDAVLQDPELGTHEPQRAALLKALDWLEMEVTCGDCAEGRCHWGGDRSRESIAAVKAGREYVDPQYGRCGCARHGASVEARERRVRRRKQAG